MNTAVGTQQFARTWLLVAMAGGVAATLPVLWFSDHLTSITLSLLSWDASWVRAFVQAAIPEETSKLLAMTCLLAVLRRRVKQVTPRSALVTGVAVGLGFALVESLIRVIEVVVMVDGASAMLVGFLRIHTALPLHVGLGALSACYVGMGAFSRAWMIPVVLHGLYDVAIFEASRGGGLFSLVLGYTVLALLIWWVARFYLWSGRTVGLQDSGRLSPL